MINKIISDPKKVMKLKQYSLPFTDEGIAKLQEIETANQAQMEYISNKSELAKLSEDMIQFSAGIAIDNIKEKKEKFLRLLNQVRTYEGKNRKRFY